jgi:hypothetical protein
MFFGNFRQNARKRNCSFIAELAADGKFSRFSRRKTGKIPT